MFCNSSNEANLFFLIVRRRQLRKINWLQTRQCITPSYAQTSLKAKGISIMRIELDYGFILYLPRTMVQGQMEGLYLKKKTINSKYLAYILNIFQVTPYSYIKRFSP